MNISERRTPESPTSLNTSLQVILREVRQNLPEGMKKSIQVTENDVSVTTSEDELFRITQHSLLLFGTTNVEDLIRGDSNGSYFAIEGFTKFLSLTGKHIKRLNHIGLSYFTPDIQLEAIRIENITKSHDQKVYEEDSGEPDQKWLFIGNANEVEQPMVKFVLTEKNGESNDLWRPHFQIDLDFDLSPRELEDYAKNAFGENFVTWKLDVPNIGIVLMMGSIGSINGTKIQLGLGTNLRSIETHRKEVMREI